MKAYKINLFESLVLKVNSNPRKINSKKHDNDFKIHLTTEERGKIPDVEKGLLHLEDVRDWLSIGCFIGQHRSRSYNIKSERQKLLDKRFKQVLTNKSTIINP